MFSGPFSHTAHQEMAGRDSSERGHNDKARRREPAGLDKSLVGRAGTKLFLHGSAQLPQAFRFAMELFADGRKKGIANL